MEGRVKRTLEEVEERRGEERGRREGWLDGECKERKGEVRKELRCWRKRGGDGIEYKRKKQEYKELCERKRNEETERWERKAAEAKGEKEVWEIINRGRKKRNRINEEIGMKEWEEYFRTLLGGGRG